MKNSEIHTVEMAELKAALRQRRGEDSGSGDDDPGLPRSPPTSPTTLDVLTHGLKGSSRATQSSCSDGSLLSMGSSENDEDSLGAASHHSSRASLLEGRHQVVEEAKETKTTETDTTKEEKEENEKEKEKNEQKEDEEGKKTKKKRKKGLRRKRGDPTRFTFVSDAIIVGREPDIEVGSVEREEEGEDHEPVAGAVRLSHQAALHKIAVRPRRTHGAPRARRATQIGGQISLPDVIEEANSRHPSGPRPTSAPQQPVAAPAPPPTPPPAAQVTPDDDVSVEESPAVRESQTTPEAGQAERKDERREDQPLFQRLFGSTSKRAGRRHSRGSGEESRENSVSPLRRGTEQRASKDRRHDTSSPRFLIGSSKPRQDAHALPPSGRPRDPSKERGSREVPQSPEDVQVAVGASAWPQGVRKTKSFREEQAPVHREALRRKVSSHAAADEQSTTPTKTSRLSTSLESIDGDDTRKPAPRSTPTSTPPTVTTASPQRSSTESLTTTPLPGVFIRQHPQPGHHRGQPHPSPPDTSSGPFSLDSSLNQQPKEVEDQMRKASSVDQMTVSESTTIHTTHATHTTHHREHVRETHTKEHVVKDQLAKEQLIKEHAAREHIIEQHIKEQHMKEQLNKEHHAREEHTKLTTTTTAKTSEAKQAAMAAAKQSLLDTLVESIKPDRKTETPKATPRRSLSQTQPPQVLPKEEPPPATPPQEPEGEQAPPRRPLRRESSVKRLPATMTDSEGVAVPEFMRIQLNRVESKGQSVIYDTEQEKGGRKEDEDVPKKDTGPIDAPKDVPVEADMNTPKKDVPVKDTPTPVAVREITRKASLQGSRPLLKEARDASPSAVLEIIESNTETTPEQQERVQLRRPVVTDRTPTADRSAAATTTPTASRDQPELFKVFARRSFKIKDSDKELFETSIEDTGVEASSEVSEMMVSSVRPSSTSPRPPVSAPQATDAQKIGINAISYNRKSVGNPALSFMPPPASSASEQGNRPQTTASTSKSPQTTASTSKSPQTTASTSKTPQPSTEISTTPPTVYSKILSNRMSGSEVSSGNESEGSVSSPVPIRAPVTPQTKPAMTARPGSAIIWPPRPQASQEETTAPQPTTAPQDTPHRKSLGSMDTKDVSKEASQDGIEVEVSPLDIGAARRRFMSASYPPDRPGTSPALGTSPPALTPSPVTPSPSPPAPTPSPPAPTHPPITSNILSRVGSIGSTTNPATPSFTVTVRTQPPADTTAPPPSTAPSSTPSGPPTGAPSPGEPAKGDAGPGQQTAEDWRVLVRQRREGRLKQTKTPDSEEIIIETRPPVSRNSKVLEMASNFQKLQVA